MREGERIVVFKGGHGGRGNARFKSSTNQNPFTHTDGKSGESGDITFTLKLIADAGLIGLPNAGKSSLLNALTSARSKVGEYPFTTLEPSLGDFYGYLIADIPGLISGASSGRGLGTRFLKHIERTGFTIHLISAEQAEPVHAYDEVRNELEAFGHGLSTKHEFVVVSKADLVPDALLANTVRKLEQHTGREVLAVSVKNATLVKRLADRLTVLLSDQSA
jgi:GTP-binding protein